MEPAIRTARYMRQLDALRTFAVVGVILSHLDLGKGFASTVAWGRDGVELFFVLSGFLITDILLQSRAAVASRETTHALALQRFYVRRFLRIFPVYYATLAATAILNVMYVRATMPWHLLYASNFLFALHGRWYGPVSHLWSLAVEEQFYVVWPCFLLFLPPRRLRTFMIATIALGPLYRLALAAAGGSYMSMEILPFGCLDLLGYGGLLALLRRDPDNDRVRMRLVNLGLYAGLPLMLAFQLLNSFGVSPAADVVAGRFFRALFFGWLVSRASVGFSGLAGRLLELPPLTYLGKISYGIYLFHNFMPECLRIVARYGFHATLPGSDLQQHLIAIAATIVAAMLSWKFFEGPINRFKERFHDGRADRGAVAV